jgi:argininosuccinate synthase
VDSVSSSMSPQYDMVSNMHSTNDPLTAPSTPQEVTIRFEKGIPVKVSSNGKEWTDSLELFMALNEIGKLHGIGRIDIVEVCNQDPV